MSRQDFEAWLRAKPVDEIVAKDWSECDCPLAKWLGNATVDPEEGVYVVNDICLCMPIWARKFGDHIDIYNREDGVSAQLCLNVLKELG